jgi:hypothetical protein
MNWKTLGIVVLVVAVIALLVYVFFPGLPKSIKVYDVVQLNKAWTPDERQWFYHTSQGSQLMPYNWFINLEQPDNKKLFIDPDYLTRFRVIPDVNPVGNPDRLPVGFAKDPGPPNPDAEGEQVGITCAGCHTGQLNYKGMGVRIDGAPGQLDVNGFLGYLAAATLITDKDPVKFDRFARRVLGSGYNSTAKDQLQQKVEKFIKGQLELQLEVMNADKSSGLKATAAGFGRIDALGQGGNTLFGKLNTKNLATLNAPVDILPLWYAYSYGWVQTNSSIRQPMARNIIEALAVNTYLDLPGSTQDQQQKGYLSGVAMENSWHMEEMASLLKAPEWPEGLFGHLDPDKVARGKVLYGKMCAGCHAPQLETPTTNDGVTVLPPPPPPPPTSLPPLPPYPPDAVAQAAGKQYYHLRIFDLDTIGTDPMDANNFANRYADATAIGLSAHEWGPQVIYPVIGGIMKRYYTDHNIPPDQQVVWNGYRGNYWRAPKAYPARPLAGIWATAPFLHNGSVPNLYELLSPVEERSTTFYTGSLDFDPQRVGFEIAKFYGAFKFDTSTTGNSNSGHEFRDGKGKGVIGRKLTEDERWQIIEFLKGLRFEDEVPPELAPPAGWPQNPGGSSPSAGKYPQPKDAAGPKPSPPPAG